MVFGLLKEYKISGRFIICIRDGVKNRFVVVREKHMSNGKQSLMKRDELGYIRYLVPMRKKVY